MADAAEHRHTWIVPRDLVHGEPHVIAARLDSQGLRCNFVKTAQANLRRCWHRCAPIADLHRRHLPAAGMA